MWVVDFNISHAALRALLAILRKSYKDVSLPKDARTVMKTPRSIETFKLGEDGAEHWHQGLATCLNMHFKNLAEDTAISININIDGLPLFNSATKCFWPILVNVHERSDILPMAAGVFYGEKKPENAAIYFKPFVDELKCLLDNGLVINGKRLSIKVRCFTCDTPVRAFVKGK